MFESVFLEEKYNIFNVSILLKPLTAHIELKLQLQLGWPFFGGYKECKLF